MPCVTNIQLIVMITVALDYCSGTSALHLKGTNFTENFSSKITLVDLGVDYHDGPVPNYFKNILANVTLRIDSLSNGYGPKPGIKRLKTAVSKLYSKLINRDLNPDSEVLITVGATEALFSAIMGLSTPGDEWIIIEPFYTSFQYQVELSKSVPRFSALKPPNARQLNAADWELDYEGMKTLINNRTRGIIFNNPNNPLGKCYNQTEIEFISYLAKRHNLLVLSDEVHEFTTDSMIRLASIPGMYERTLTISSASKVFNVPGWRIGWIYGPAELISLVETVHDEVVGFASKPQQEAVSVIIEDEINSFGLENSIRKSSSTSSGSFLAKNLVGVKRKRKFIVEALRKAGMLPIVPQGGYCMLASWPPLDGSNDKLKQCSGCDQGEKFANWMKEIIGVAGFTGGKYYSEKHRPLGLKYIRFCYQKSEKTLQRAAENLRQLRRFEESSNLMCL